MMNRLPDKILQKVQKPARYTGGEPGSVIKTPDADTVRFAFCFPDLYEIGMSHLGMKILYGLLNSRDDVWCERVFAPAPDMEGEMRAAGLPLYALESLDPLYKFDVVGFTLQYELSYTAILNMLDLGKVPLRAEERTEAHPLVIGGGPTACNPEPIADFFDLFVLGDGEKATSELIDLVKTAKADKLSRAELLGRAALIEGVYVPSLYRASYNPDGTVASVEPVRDGLPAKVSKSVVIDPNELFYPDRFVVPFTETVHDRAVAELFRGCIRGCRFCQAGFIYRPYREKRPEVVARQAKALCKNCGYDELSLASLSTSDYTGLGELLDDLLTWTEKEKVSISLPSLRVDNFSEEVMQKIARVRKTGLTFAPEAGTQRMRDVINKNVTEKQVIDTARIAFEAGYSVIKLYFMVGLPTETPEDIVGIVDLAQKVVDLYYSLPGRQKGKGVTVTVSAATFVPKAFTPFEFEPQASAAELEQKQKLLLSSLNTKKINVNYHMSDTSLLEAVLARGDRRLCDVVYRAWEKGSKLDGWNEHFKFSRWREALEECGLDPAFYANRRREYDEVFPWDHLDYGVSKDFLVSEHRAATESAVTPNCAEKCSACGAAVYGGGVCFAKSKDIL